MLAAILKEIADSKVSKRGRVLAFFSRVIAQAALKFSPPRDLWGLYAVCRFSKCVFFSLET